MAGSLFVASHTFHNKAAIIMTGNRIIAPHTLHNKAAIMDRNIFVAPTPFTTKQQIIAGKIYKYRETTLSLYRFLSISNKFFF